MIYAQINSQQFSVLELTAYSSNNHSVAELVICEQSTPITPHSEIQIIQNKQIIWSGVITTQSVLRKINCRIITIINAESYLCLLNMQSSKSCYANSIQNICTQIIDNNKRYWQKIKYIILDDKITCLWSEQSNLASWTKFCSTNSLYVSICCKRKSITVSDNIAALSAELQASNTPKLREIYTANTAVCANTFQLVSKNNTKLTIHTACINIQPLQKLELIFNSGDRQELIIDKIISSNKLDDGRNSTTIFSTVILRGNIKYSTDWNNYYGAYYKSDNGICFNADDQISDMPVEQGLAYCDKDNKNKFFTKIHTGCEVICFNGSHDMPISIGCPAARNAQTALTTDILLSWKYKSGIAWEFIQTSAQQKITFGNSICTLELQTDAINYNATTINLNTSSLRQNATTINIKANNKIQNFSKSTQYWRCKKLDIKSKQHQIICAHLKYKCINYNAKKTSYDILSEHISVKANSCDLQSESITLSGSNLSLAGDLQIQVGASSLIISSGTAVFNAPIINILTSSQSLPIP